MNDQNTSQTANGGTEHILDLTSNIVVAFVSNSHMHLQKDDLSDLIKATFGTLTDLGGMKVEAAPAVAEAPVKKEPFTSIRKSVQPEYLVCLHDGTKVKMLKRYLMTNYQQTPEQYRTEFNLPADYPMVAPEYSNKRRELAKAIGLGTKGRVSKGAIEALAAVTETDPKVVAAEAAGKTAPAEGDANASKSDAAPAKRAPRRKKADAATGTAPKRRSRKAAEPAKADAAAA
jgi:predicted transcriptional regulator